MTWIFLETTTPCRPCGRSRPLDGVVKQIACFCGEERSIPGSSWEIALQFAATHVPSMEEEQQELDVHEAIVGLWGRAAPRCSRCGEVLLEAEHEPTVGEIRCAGCGAEHTLSGPPDFVDRSALPPITILLPAAPEVAVAAAPDERGDTFDCTHCGGHLRVDGSHRTVTCSYCSSSVYLPDELWARLQGTLRPQRWYLWAGTA